MKIPHSNRLDPTVRRRLVATALMVVFGLQGFILGFYTGTGEMPVLWREDASIMTPEVADVDAIQAASAVERDEVNQQEYRQGYNCVDYAWDTMRNLAWEGIPAYMGILEYEGGEGHAIVAIPTKDRGLVWFDAQTDKEIEPRIGKVYHGQRIADIQIVWVETITLDEFKAKLEANCEECNG